MPCNDDVVGVLVLRSYVGWLMGEFCNNLPSGYIKFKYRKQLGHIIKEVEVDT